MKLRDPFFISSRLLPALKIGNGDDEATISLEPVGCRNNRLVWKWYVDFKDGREFSDDDMESPGSDSPAEYQAAFGTLLSFMSACGESVGWCLRNKREPDEDDNASLFPEGLREWCHQYDDELDSLRFQLEEGEDGGETEAYLSEGDDE